MSHSPELIASIRELVELDYPPRDHDYAIELALPGTRMFPDIVVQRTSDGHIVCIVEIGYTRPEKLTYYRDELRVPDVRWYDKQGHLHTTWREELVRVRAELAGLQPTDVFVYKLTAVMCACGWPDELDDGLGADELDELIGDLSEEQWIDTLGYLITDRVRFWVAAFCDKCGSAWMVGDAQEASRASDIDNDLIDGYRFTLSTLNARELARHWGPRIETNWETVVAFVERHFELTPHALDDAHFIDEEARNRFAATLRVATGG